MRARDDLRMMVIVGVPMLLGWLLGAGTVWYWYGKWADRRLAEELYRCRLEWKLP